MARMVVALRKRSKKPANLLVSHADRSRVVAEADRGRITMDGREIVGTLLVDGFAGGTWKIHRKGGRAVLAVAPFARLARAEAAALAEEGERLLAFTDSEAAHSNRLFSLSTARLLEPSVSSAWNTPFTPIVDPVGGGADVSLITVSVPVPSFTW
jgi:hypothetical protein